jgi:hypothetical protein
MIELKDLQRWVKGYGITFKVVYGPRTGCTVSIYEGGCVEPSWTVHGFNMVVAFCKADKLLEQKLLKKNGGKRNGDYKC